MGAKQILVLGGTNFIGRNLIEKLQNESAYEITLFNRGITNPHLFPTLKKINGDRELPEDLGKIFTQRWNHIIDLSGFYPNNLEQILKGINADLSSYIFVSTCSVYDNALHSGMLRDESAPTLVCSASKAIDTSLNTYGQRKAECERVLQRHNIPYTIFRPALVYGPYDSTDRLYYWLYRCYKHKELLIPEQGERVFSMTYVHDLVEAIVAALGNDIQNQIYNCTSHPQTSIGQIVQTCEALNQREIKKVDASVSFLDKNGIAQWMDLPLWLHSDDFTYSNYKIKRELKVRPKELEHGLKTTMNYYKDKATPEPQYGISRSKEEELMLKLNK